MLIVLADADNKFITYGFVDPVPASTTATIKATSTFKKTSLADYYKNGSLADNSVRVFVICNYTGDLKNRFEGNAFSLGDTKWVDEICEVVEENGNDEGKNKQIWSRGNMLMSNAVIATKYVPRTFKEWDAYSAASTPLDLSIASTTSNGDRLENGGSVRVERSVARFDFRDGSSDATPANTYHVVATVLPDETNPNPDPTDIVDIRLDRMALVNMSNKFYYFRRVTAAGSIDEGGVCHPEYPSDGGNGNYVIDVDYDTKTSGPAAYNFPLFGVNSGVIDGEARDQWYNSLISDVLGENKDNDEYDTKQYKIWRYVTENTVNNTDRMTAGLSTGVVFKGKMIPTAAARTSTDAKIKKLADVLDYKMEDTSLGLGHNTNTDPIFYSFGGNLYLQWPSVREAAKDAATIEDGEGNETINYANSFYEAVFGKRTSETDVDPTSPDYLWQQWSDAGKSEGPMLDAFKAAATKSGITLYQSSEDEQDGWGYYCYYFYWNRHNTNDNPSVIGPMEFAVVRNNVYKIAVTGISRLGHPRLSENDPDPVDPDNPDESGEVYISVDVEVLPWVVRVNDIEF